jgi:hypothetical protein
MSWQDFVLKLSAEGRAWFQMLIPIISAAIAGWVSPQPRFTKTPQSKEEG